MIIQQAEMIPLEESWSSVKNQNYDSNIIDLHEKFSLSNSKIYFNCKQNGFYASEFLKQWLKNA